MTLPAAAVVALVFMCLVLMVGLALLILCTHDGAREQLQKTLSGYTICPHNEESLDDVRTHTTSSRRHHSDARRSASSAFSEIHNISRPVSVSSHDERRYNSSERRYTSHEQRKSSTHRQSGNSFKQQLLPVVSSGTDSGESRANSPRNPQQQNSSAERPLKGILRNGTRKTSFTSGYDTTSSTGDQSKHGNRKSVHLETTVAVHTCS